LYPSLKKDLTAFKREIRKLNKFSFQGLITSFDFSYTTEGSVDVTISLTGTSNTYTDVTMLMNPDTKKNETKTFKVYDAVATASVAQLQELSLETGSGSTEFYGQIFNRFEELLNKFKTHNQIDPKQNPPMLIPFNIVSGLETGSDHFMLYGKLYPNIQTPPFKPQTFVADPSSSIDITTQSSSFQQQQEQAKSTYNAQWESYVATQRYITLGALIQCVNNYITPKLEGSVEQYDIKCTDLVPGSNYYPQLTSCIPKDILLLPNNENLKSNDGGMSVYGGLKMYPDVLKTMETKNVTKWPGIFGTPNQSDSTVIFPSRIFINLEYIQTVLNELSAKNTKQFTLASFLANISARISYATGNAIILKLVTDPNNQQQLLFSDTKYLKPINTKNPVTAYSVPMLANHPNGTIVREFTFQAKLPNNVKNLSYVLNSGTDVSDDEIAPYLNFMYNSKDPDSINKAREKYKNKYEQNIKNLDDAKISYGEVPLVRENTTKLYKALIEYIKFPFPDIEKSKQLTAPIFPFDVEFTMDGINGLRYGDVLTFAGLPEKYKKNTVFSVIGITHDVDTDGVWTSKVKCIMRPKLG